MYVKLVKDQNVNQELNQLNVKHAKAKVQLILDKGQCKLKWGVIVVQD